MQSMEHNTSLFEERNRLKVERKTLVKRLENIDAMIGARKKLIRSLDPKLNAPIVIDEQKEMLEKYRVCRRRTEEELKANTDRIKELGRKIFEANQAKHDYKEKHKEIRRFNRAFTARIHRYEREEALQKVEDHNKAFLGEVENEET